MKGRIDPMEVGPAAKVARYMEDNGMVICTCDDLDRIGPVIGSSFSEDPVWTGFFPFPLRLRGTTAVFSAAASYTIKNGFLVHTGGGRGSYIGMMDSNAFSMQEMLNADTEGLMTELLSCTDMENALSLWRMSSEYDRSRTDRADVYLFLFFTHPLDRGRGQGSAIMKMLVDALDIFGLSCSLSTHNPVNLPIYNHLGFRTVVSRNSDRGDAEYFLLHP